MSASPSAAPSTKRPLEDPSSPAGPSDQPEAKRPALEKEVTDDKAATGDNAVTDPEVAVAAESINAEEQSVAASTNGNDTVIPDAPIVSSDLQPIQSTTSANSRSANTTQHQDESQYLHLRAVISTSEAATVIGKGGENVQEIRRQSGAKCTVSDYTRGAAERIITVSGPVDAVSKAFGLVVRTLNQEDLVNPSDTQSKSYPMRLLIPHILIGSIIGKGGVRIREIQDASNAKLNASDTLLPGSGERSLVVLGVADAVHIAVYYVASTLVEQLTERFGGPAASQYATRNGTQANMVPGGMTVQPYVPQHAGGQYGHPDTYRRHQPAPRTPTTAYAGYNNMPGQPAAHQPMQPNMGYAAHSPSRPAYGQPPPVHPGYGAPGPSVGQPPMPTHGAAGSQQTLTQQIYIPNDMVGAIIGKGGAKINEIRQYSGSVIKINEPTDNNNERLVTITGTQDCNQMALFMLYQRLESEKHRV